MVSMWNVILALGRMLTRESDLDWLFSLIFWDYSNSSGDLTPMGNYLFVTTS